MNKKTAKQARSQARRVRRKTKRLRKRKVYLQKIHRQQKISNSPFDILDRLAHSLASQPGSRIIYVSGYDSNGQWRESFIEPE